MYIIPAIDIYDGQCVRLVEGDFSHKTTYSSDPELMARRFLEAGARHLHVVDLEGAKEGSVVNWLALERILSVKGLDVQVGGGVRTEEDIKRLVEAGVVHVVVGSVAVRSPEIIEEWVLKFSPNIFCIALDMKDGALAYNGWQKTEDRKPSDVVERMMLCGILRFLSTDIRRDGTLAGPNLELYSTLTQKYPNAQWLASGGVRSIEDVRALEPTGVAGVIIGKALYEGKLKLEDLLGSLC